MKQDSIDITFTPATKTSPSRRAELLTWPIIFIIVVFLVAGNAVRASQTSPGVPLDEVRMRLLAQEAIAFKSLLPDGPAKGPTDPILRLIREFDSQARTTPDKVRAAILVAYLRGKPEALSRLNAISGGTNSSEVTDDIAVLLMTFRDDIGALQPGEADQLILRYGYFGRLAVAAGAAQDTPARKSIETAARRTLLVLGMAAVWLVIMIAVSITLFVAAIVYWWKGKMHASYESRPEANAVYLQAFALYLVLFVVLGLVIHGLGLAGPNWNWLAWLIIPAVIVLIAKRSRPQQDWRIGLGWHSGRGWLRESAAGILGYLACIPVIAIGIAITFGLVRLTGNVPRDAITPLLRSNALSLYGLACIYAPVLEETMFRGALFHHLRVRWGWAPSALVVAFIFAVIHPQGWVAVPALGAIAMSLAAIREWRGTIIASMTAHAFNNFLATTVALLLLRSN